MHAIRDFGNREICDSLTGTGNTIFLENATFSKRDALNVRISLLYDRVKFRRRAIRRKRIPIEIMKEQSDKLDFVEIKFRFLYVLRVPRNDRNT